MDDLKLMTFKKSILVLLLAISCIACEKSNTTEKTAALNNGQLPPSLRIDQAAADRVADALWEKSQKQLSNTLTKAMALQQAIAQLLKKPTEKSLKTAQKEWRSAIIAYQQLSPLLYLKNKQANAKKPTEKNGTEKPETQEKTDSPLSSVHHWRNRIAAWPIQPGYIDSFGPHVHSGIVNDINLSIDAHTLRGQHLLTDDHEVTIGLYTIEYLLFGDRDYKGKKNTHYKRFLNATTLPEPLAKAGLVIDELPSNRRRSLITLQARLLVNDIQTLIGLYQSSGALALEFQELAPLEKLQAFQNSIGHSLQHIDKLFTFYKEELIVNNVEEEPKDKKTKGQSAFSQRFYANTKLALKNNLATINSLHGDSDSKDDDKNIKDISLFDALFSEKKKDNILQLTKNLEDESNKKEANLEKIILATRNLSKALLL